MKTLAAVLLAPALALALGACGGEAVAVERTSPAGQIAPYAGPAEGAPPSSGLRGYDDQATPAVRP